ncbi:DUF411 domain-containing protein [Agrobacterium vitis]|uniref:DUF411 domain-containing protein n=1 Tax=Agrobacterium vitis TaxID=373 RepID=A0ABW9TSX4_AGRVI|nr:DUF411 domain-containing protein [Agrobacterium vitis]MUO45404.1 DUF411 domain-containing protein [Agrobacterium vitis]
MKRREFLCTLVAVGAMPIAGQALAAGESMVVYKDPNCGCCHAWAGAMKNAGFSVKVEDVADMNVVKQRYKVPGDLQGCHTAIVAGYYLEGHVPLEAVVKLLAEKPDFGGLSVPGMPVGSLGMGDDPGASYDVIAIGKDGTRQVYQAVRPNG